MRKFYLSADRLFIEEYVHLQPGLKSQFALETVVKQ